MNGLLSGLGTGVLNVLKGGTGITAAQRQREIEDRNYELAKQKQAQTGATTGVFGGTKDPYLTAVSILNNPEARAKLDETSIKSLESFRDSRAKGLDNTYGQAYTSGLGKGQAAIETKPVETRLSEEAKRGVESSYARDIAREKAMGANMMTESDAGVVPIKGSPMYLEQAKKAEEKIKQSELDESQREVITNNVNNALRVLSEPSFFPKAGTGSNVVSFFTSTKAAELESYLDSIRSNVALNKLIEVKKAGGTFGALQKNEMDALEASLGKLKTAQNPKVLEDNLKVVLKYYNRAVQNSGGNLEAELDAKLGELKGGEYQEGQTATNPTTGQVLVYRNGNWEAQ